MLFIYTHIHKTQTAYTYYFITSFLSIYWFADSFSQNIYSVSSSKYFALTSPHSVSTLVRLSQFQRLTVERTIGHAFQPQPGFECQV